MHSLRIWSNLPMQTPSLGLEPEDSGTQSDAMRANQTGCLLFRDAAGCCIADVWAVGAAEAPKLRGGAFSLSCAFWHVRMGPKMNELKSRWPTHKETASRSERPSSTAAINMKCVPITKGRDSSLMTHWLSSVRRLINRPPVIFLILNIHGISMG